MPDFNQSSADVFLKQVLEEMRVTRKFLANWFAGRLDKPGSLEDFYLGKVLHESFTTVRPDGTRLDRDQTLHVFFENLYGSEPTVIRHENLDILSVLNTGTIAVIAYNELHVYPDRTATNALTAVFLINETAPNGVSWLSVHETPVEK